MTRPTAEYWIKQLKLEAHPEGGYFKEVYRAAEFIQKKGLPGRYSGFRSFSTSIYFLLTGDQFSAFHRLKSDEVWHFYQGDPLVIHILTGNGKSLSVHLGPDLSKKQYLQFAIPRGAWFAAQPLNKNGFSLLGCTVAPGFDFDDFELGGRELLIRAYPKSADLINQFTIRP
jgi:predicted cupin superfamily sugar epimerase